MTQDDLKNKEMPQNYDFAEAEKKWQRYWEENDIYKFDPAGDGEIYSVDTPPPTVSGNMHLGHAFSYSQEDFVVRFQRMLGKRVFYPFGTDDNGLPTERLVEKLKKVKSTRMTRPEFVKLCHETITEIKPDFIQDWKDIGMSCDFKNTTYSTIDPHCIKTAQRSLLDLYKKGLIVRQAAPSMWCVNCQTAIAQAELEDADLNSTFNDVTFRIVESKEEITIATTRPELLAACVCVFVHPTDKRYHHLIGKTAMVPLFHQEVPIFADESADPEKGSGILMICSYGDRFDVDAINRKRLDPRVCITRQGLMNENAGKYEGMKIVDARKAILADLEDAGLLTSKKQITHVVNVHDKCGTAIEFLATEQWFIKILEHKQQLLESGNSINWYPKSMKARYDNWVQNLNWDWCISRQRHFGVPFPFWFSKKTGEVILADESQLPVDPISDIPKTLPDGHMIEDIEPENDVMDTWATSSVSPQITTNWVDNKENALSFKDMYPMTMRPQAHDIIRTWAFYTIVKGMYHHDMSPWKDIVISGHVLDPKGNKMSKSKGNAINPRSVLEKFGSDALRFWAAGSKLGDDLPFLEKDLVTGRKMVTKLWNASKFAIMHLQDFDGEFNVDNLYPVDRWILSKLHGIISASTETFSRYEYSKTKLEVEKFFWKDFCDNYLEIVKDRLYNQEAYDPAAVRSAKFTLHQLVLDSLKMMAPIMPFITEEIYHLHFAAIEGKKSIHISDWPKFDKAFVDAESEVPGEMLVDILNVVRKHKSEKQVSLKTPIENMCIQCSKEDKKKLSIVLQDLKAVTKSESIVFSGGVPDIDCERFAMKVGIVLGEAPPKKQK